MANGNFRQRLEGLLSGASPIGNLGLGLLAASGPSTTPRSFGQVLAQASQFASERQRAAMQNQAMRQALEDSQSRREAMQQLPGLLAQTTVAQAPSTQQITGIGGEAVGRIPGRQGLIPTVQTPEGQQQLMGLLAQANPQDFSRDLIGQMLTSQAPPEFASPIGKMIGDLEVAEVRGNQAAADQIRTAIEQELGDEVDLNQVRSVRNDVIRNSEGFMTAQQGYNRVLIGAQSATPAGDLALIFGIMKIFDPTSAVREGEQATVRNAGGVPDRIRNWYNRVLTGESFTPEQRQDFVNQAHSQFEKSVEQQQRIVEDARGFAERNSLPFADVVPEFVIPQSLSPVQIEAPTTETPQRTLRSPLTQTERDELRRLRRELGLGGD